MSIVITSQPKDEVAAIGAKVKFTVVAGGEGLTYQWQYSSDGGTNWPNTPLEGGKTDTLTVPVTANRDGMLYRCKIKDANGTIVYSRSAKLTVDDGVKYLIKSKTLKDIANAIRSVTGETEPMTPEMMATKIRELSSTLASDV